MREPHCPVTHDVHAYLQEVSEQTITFLKMIWFTFYCSQKICCCCVEQRLDPTGDQALQAVLHQLLHKRRNALLDLVVDQVLDLGPGEAGGLSGQLLSQVGPRHEVLGRVETNEPFFFYTIKF